MSRVLGLLAGVSLVLAACGDDPALDDRGAGSRAEQLIAEHGCAGCHSTDGSRGRGPTWEGLAGSEVALEDGTTVVADTAHLTRAIEDPGADIRDGYLPIMPDLDLTADEVAALVAHIESLG